MERVEEEEQVGGFTNPAGMAATTGGMEDGMAKLKIRTMEEDAVVEATAGAEPSTEGGVGQSSFSLQKLLFKVSSSTDNELISKFYSTVETSMKGDPKNVEELLSLLLEEENEMVIKFYVLLMEKYMYFDNWRCWMGSGIRGSNPLLSESLMIRMKNPSNIHRILQKFKAVDKNKFGSKELLGDLLVCMSMPRMFRNHATVYFNAEQEVWAYTFESLQAKDRWTDGLIMCSSFLKKSREDPEILHTFSEVCKFLPQLPKLVTHILFSHEPKTSDEIELAVNCLCDLARLGSCSSGFYTYCTFFRAISCAVRQLYHHEHFEELEALCNGFSKAIENSTFTTLFCNFYMLLEFLLGLALQKTLDTGLRLAALNVVITGCTEITNDEINGMSENWKSHVVKWICALIFKEVDVPAELIYFDLASCKESENSIFVSSIRLLEIVAEKFRADTLFDLTMPEIDKYIHSACYKTKFAAFVILGVAIGAGGNMQSLSVSPHRMIWDTALELGTCGRGSPAQSVTMAGLMFTINESCKYQKIIAMADSTRRMLDNLKPYFENILSRLVLTPGDASLQEVAFQTLDSLAAVLACHNVDDVTKEHEWKTITGSLLNELGCHKLCYVIKQTALYGILRLVDRCGHVAVHYYRKICETLMKYMADLVEEEKCKCQYKVHASPCGTHDKSRSYEYCVDIMQSLLLEMTSPDYTFFHNIFVRFVGLYYTVDDPDLHTSILKYLTTFCSKFGTSMSTQTIESVIQCATYSLETDDGSWTLSMCNIEYSKYFASEWEKFVRGDVWISVWDGHFGSNEDKLVPLAIPYPYQAERVQSIKLIKALSYKIGTRFHPYLDTNIELLTRAVHDSSIPVRIQALESLTNLLCYKHKTDAAECNSKIYSTMKLALECIQRNCCMELLIACMESITMFLKDGKIPAIESELVWCGIADILLEEEDYFESMKNEIAVEEVGRIVELRHLCVNAMPHFAKTWPNEEFADYFMDDKMIGVFESLLSPKWSMLPSNPNAMKILHLQIDAVGVIGDLMKHISKRLSSDETERLFSLLDSKFASDEQLMRCNSMYAVGEMCVHCDHQLVSQRIPKVSKQYEDYLIRLRNNLAPNEAARCLGVLSKMALARIDMVNLCDILKVTFSYLPLTQGLDEYEHILILFGVIFKIPSYKHMLEPYFHQFLRVSQDIYWNASWFANDTIVGLTEFLENEVRKELPE